MTKPARKKPFDWPPPPEPESEYVPRARNPVHSILSALPIIMLVVGFWFYHDGESEQNEGMPIRAESVDSEGIFTGLSVVESALSDGRHYLWFEQDGKARGVRIRPEQAELLDTLERGEPLRLRMAPTVSGSRTYWPWYVEQHGQVLIDNEGWLQ